MLVSMIVEMNDFYCEFEVGFCMFGLIDEFFYNVIDVYAFFVDGIVDGVFIFMGYDVMMYFEMMVWDVVDIY